MGRFGNYLKFDILMKFNYLNEILNSAAEKLWTAEDMNKGLKSFQEIIRIKHAEDLFSMGPGIIAESNSKQ
jgi:hypothetical protein